jgi:hypothetical protein
MATKLAPEEFAQLTAQEQRAYQVNEAEQIFQAIERGETVSESQRDFAFRILGKVMPEAPTPTGFENTAKGLDDLAGAFGLGTFKALWPVLLAGVLFIIGLYFWGRRNG